MNKTVTGHSIIKGLVVVAHPDDCVIFANPLIENTPNVHWTIVYLTYQDWNPRAKEMRQYWNSRAIPTIFLGYEDDYRDTETGKLSFNVEQAEKEIINFCANYDVILTHNVDGDYGHIHHKFVNATVAKANKPTVTFASTFNCNYTCTGSDIDLDCFPLHREVIVGFEDRTTGRYSVDPKTQELLGIHNVH